MATQNYNYPSSSTVTISAIGTNGLPIPSTSILIGGENPSGNLIPLQVDSGGALIVSPLTSSSVVKAQLQDNNGVPIVVGQALMATSLPVVIASNQTAISVTGPLTDAQLRATPVPVSGTVAVTGPLAVTQGTTPWVVDGSGFVQPISASALPLPSGASTSALQTTGNASLASIDSKLTSPLAVIGPLTDAQLRATPVPVSGTVAVTGPLSVTQGTTPWVVDGSGFTQPISAVALPLPTGAATSALQTSGNASLTSIDGKLNSLGQKTSAGSVPVVFASDQSTLPTNVGGNVPNGFVRNNYSSVNVTTAAYVQLFASTAAITNVAEIFDSSGQTLVIAFGAAASEVDQFLVSPGGNGRMTLRIPAGTRISIKAVSANATSGEIDLNLYT